MADPPGQPDALPRRGARAIDRSTADIVCVQHEFGLYGLWKGGGFVGDQWIEGTYEDHLTPFLEELKKPALVNMHTVLPDPSPAIRDAVRSIADVGAPPDRDGRNGRRHPRARLRRDRGPDS